MEYIRSRNAGNGNGRHQKNILSFAMNCRSQNADKYRWVSIKVFLVKFDSTNIAIKYPSNFFYQIRYLFQIKVLIVNLYVRCPQINLCKIMTN